MKTVPVFGRCADRIEFEHVMVHTGQHYDR